MEPLQIGQTRTLTIAGKDYTAVNQGTTDLSYVFPQYRSRTFWLVRDAYGDVKNLPAIANMLPYDNYPDDVEGGPGVGHRVYRCPTEASNGNTTGPTAPFTTASPPPPSLRADSPNKSRTFLSAGVSLCSNL